MFVPCDSLVERLTVREAAEVEGRAPSVLVEVGGKIVIAGGGKGCQSRSIRDCTGDTPLNIGAENAPLLTV